MLVISKLLANSQANGGKSCKFCQKIVEYSQACEPTFSGLTGFSFLGSDAPAAAIAPPGEGGGLKLKTLYLREYCRRRYQMADGKCEEPHIYSARIYGNVSTGMYLQVGATYRRGSLK